MADKPAKRQRRQHLKNVRRASKDNTPSVRKKSASAQAATISGGNVMLTLGLIVTSVVLLLFLASALMQYGFNFAAGSSSSPSQTNGQAAALPAVERSTIEVRILNGCGASGASRQMTTRIRDLGFDVVIADNADHFGYEHTLVVDHTDRTEVGNAVAGALGCGQLSAQHDEMAMAHVTVVLGKDWESFLGRAAQTDGKQDQDWIDQLNGKVQQLME